MKFFNYKLFFKIYLLFIVSFHLLMEFKDHEPFETIDYFDYPLVFIALLGVFGYAFNKKISFPKFWQIYLFFIILWDLYRNFYGFEYNSIKSSFELSLMLLFYFSIYTPTYIAIFLYGHQEENKLVKKRTKKLLIILSIILASNAIIYKLTYDYVDMKSFIIHTKLDVFKLKAYDKNDTTYLDISMNGNIDSVLHDIGKTGDLKKYKSLCEVFDKELFKILDKYDKKSIEKYGVFKDKKLQNIRKNIDKGIIKMKKFCNEEHDNKTQEPI